MVQGWSKLERTAEVGEGRELVPDDGAPANDSGGRRNKNSYVYLVTSGLDRKEEAMLRWLFHVRSRARRHQNHDNMEGEK